VLLIDRLADSGQANTGRSNAMFRNTFTSADNQKLASAAIDYYLHVQDDLHTDIGVDSVGYLWLMTDEQLAASSHHLERMASNGVDLRTYERSDLVRMMAGFVDSPASGDAALMHLGSVSSGVFGSKCGRLAPDRLAGHYRDQFTALGGSVMFGSEVRKLNLGAKEPIGLEGEPLVWQDWRATGVVLADGTEIQADKIVVAAGAWTNELLDPTGIDGHTKAKKRQLFTIQTSGNPALERLLLSGGFNASGVLPFVILPRAGVFIKAVRESGEFWIGCEDEVNRPFISLPDHDLENYPAEPSYYERGIYPVLKEYFPQFEGARPARMWGGLYGYNTIDNVPFVFAEGNLVVVGGDSGSGVMKGDSIGRIADAVCREGEEAEAELYGGVRYKASKLGFRSRDVEREDWLL
jgi:glycine/D-amino acid oxidase-like deaminating enzyme